jgi:hypothetical protein
MTVIVVTMLMTLWVLTLTVIAAVPIFFRRGGREWHRRTRKRQPEGTRTVRGAPQQGNGWQERLIRRSIRPERSR